MDELLFINFLVIYIYYIFIWCLIFEILYILCILIPQTYHWQIILPFTFSVFFHWLFLPLLSRHFLLNFMLSHSSNHGLNSTEVLYQSPWSCLYLSILLYKFYSFRGYLKVLAHMQWFLGRMRDTGLISLSINWVRMERTWHIVSFEILLNMFSSFTHFSNIGYRLLYTALIMLISASSTLTFFMDFIRKGCSHL